MAFQLSSPAYYEASAVDGVRGTEFAVTKLLALRVETAI